MEIIDPGHIYKAQNLDTDKFEPGYGADNIIAFVKREGNNYPGNTDSHSGTIIQELMRISIDRLKYVDNQHQDNRNYYSIEHLREVICLLEERAAERHNLSHELELLLQEKEEPETLPTCNHCGHIVCKRFNR